MKTLSHFIVTFACAGLLGGAVLFNQGEAYASDKHKYNRGYSHDRGLHRGHYGYRKPYSYRRPYSYGRPYGYRYPGYGYYHSNSDVWAWLALGVITWAVVDGLSENQQRIHEQAQISATTAPIGETIIWNQGGASGSVKATRDGMNTSGQYCREFQHEVIVAGKREQAYGTACRQPDGSWRVLSSETP